MAISGEEKGRRAIHLRGMGGQGPNLEEAIEEAGIMAEKEVMGTEIQGLEVVTEETEVEEDLEVETEGEVVIEMIEMIEEI
jgi:hypothetical protein